VLAIAVGDVFGGASVLAGACDRLALLPNARYGLSGPAVIETARGRDEIAADDARAVGEVFGAPARARAGIADLVEDDATAVRAWIDVATRNAAPFEPRVRELHARLAGRVGFANTGPPWVAIDGGHAVVRAAGTTIGPHDVLAIDAELLACLDAGGLASVTILEDSLGHEPTRGAELAGLSQLLAHHSCVLGLLRSRGVRIDARLVGTGHSAAFFANALQADRVEALPSARVVAMDPPAMARVLKLDPARLASLVEDDPLLGHPVRHFAALGGATIVGR